MDARALDIQDMGKRAFLTDLFETAVAAADPLEALREHLPDAPKGRLVVVGAGKGAAHLAAAFETLWAEKHRDKPISGVVVTRYGYAVPCRHIKVIEAAHPVPDVAGLRAAEALMTAVSGLSADDLVVALMCGGGSSLLPAPAGDLTLADEQALNEALLASGAPIAVMNALRKQFSTIKGGRLAAAAHPARVVSLVVSDVPGDDPAQVASGPTVASAVPRDAARALLDSYRIVLTPALLAHLEQPDDGLLPDDCIFRNTETRVIASARLSLEAAAGRARAAGLAAVILSDAIEGEARDIGLMHAAIAREGPFAAPAVILSGGETSVTLRAKGRGGRNTEFLLSFAQAIDGVAGIVALAADTDGIDGSEDNAGAFADGTSAARLRALGMDARSVLARNDAWGAFDALGDLFVTGPTGTNVNDFRAILLGDVP